MVILALLVSACSGIGGAEITSSARLWAAGPARWLMQPEELQRFRQLRGNRQVLEFIEEFWRRRDPTPGESENPVRAAFFERAAAADQLYSENDLPGSLSDRGRALILLGHPPILRTKRKAVPRLDPQLGDRAERAWVRLSSWVYPLAELDERLREMLGEMPGDELQLTFVHDGDRTYLLEGERYLKLASRALVRPEALP